MRTSDDNRWPTRATHDISLPRSATRTTMPATPIHPACFAVLRLIGVLAAVALWTVSVLFAVCIVAALVLTPVSWLLLPVALLAFARHRYRTTRRSERETLLHVAGLTALGQPIGLAADVNLGERGPTRRRLVALAERTGRGMTLHGALRRTCPRLAPSVHAAVQLAEDSGRLPETLERLTRPDPADVQTPGTQTHPALALMSFLILVSLALVSAAALTPSISEVLVDFNLQPPPLTGLLIAPLEWYSGAPLGVRSNAGAECLPLAGLIFVLLAVLLLAIGTLLTSVYLPRALLTPTRALLQAVPLLGRPLRDAAAATLSYALADAVEAGRTDPFASAGRSRGLGRLHAAAVRASRHAEAGAPPAEAAAAARLPPHLAHAFRTATTPNGLARSLRFAGALYTHRVRRAQILVQAAVSVVLTLAGGLLTLFMALAFFLPLITILTRLM